MTSKVRLVGQKEARSQSPRALVALIRHLDRECDSNKAKGCLHDVHRDLRSSGGEHEWWDSLSQEKSAISSQDEQTFETVISKDRTEAYL